MIKINDDTEKLLLNIMSRRESGIIELKELALNKIPYIQGYNILQSMCRRGLVEKLRPGTYKKKEAESSTPVCVNAK